MAFFKEVVNKSAMEDCGMKGVRGQGIKKGSKWWNDGVKIVLEEKWQMLERWLHNRSEEWEMYKEKNRGKKSQHLPQCFPINPIIHPFNQSP